MNLNPKDELLYGQACGLWGIDAQLLMLVEECAELQQAILHLRRGRVGVDDVASELADVLIMIEQTTCILFAHDAVDSAKAAKLQRLKERVSKAMEALTVVRRPPTQPTTWGGSVPELDDMNIGGKP